MTQHGADGPDHRPGHPDDRQGDGPGARRAEPHDDRPEPPRTRLGAALMVMALLAVLAIGWAIRQSGIGQRWYELTHPPRLPPGPAWTANPGAAKGTHEGDRPGVLLVLRDGQTLVSVDRAGQVMGLPDRSPATTTLVAGVLTEGLLPRPSAIAGLASADARPTAAESLTLAQAVRVRPMQPVGTIVRDARPTFRWRPAPQSASYRVSIVDEQGASVASSAVVATTSWTSTVALEAGRVYAWQVTPQDGSAAGAVAHFRVIDAQAAEALNARLARAGRSNLLKALAFLDAGLLDESEQAVVGLLADNDGSDRVRSLLEQLRAMRATPAQSATPPQR